MSLNFTKIAEEVLKNKGIEPTKERISSVVASVRVSGVNQSSVEAVTACAEVAVNSSMKFDWGKFKKAPVVQAKKEETSNVSLNFTGIDCPRCGKPTVYANINERKVAYCTNGCNIAVPFPVR